MTDPIPETSALAAEVEALRRQLAAEEERRRNRDRDLVEQTARTREAEARLDAIRQTMAFGLGQALVDALRLPGLVRLPRRILDLRARQKEKRGWQTTHAVEQAPAEEMRLVEPARVRAATDGTASAAAWVEGRPRGMKAAKARALAELAIDSAAADPALAADLGHRALALSARETRVVALALRLHDAGEIAAPLALLDGIEPGLLTPGVSRRRSGMQRSLGLLTEGLPVAPRRTAPAGERSAVLAARSLPWAGDMIAWRAGETGVVSGEEASDAALRRAGIGHVRIVLSDPDRDAAAIAGALRAGAEVTLDIGWLPRELLATAESERRRAAEAWLRGMIGAADRVIARGEAYREVAARFGAGRIELLPDAPVPPPALDDEAREDLARTLRLPPDRVLLVCPVGLDGDAGLDGLVEASAAHPRLALLFCGSGPGLPRLARAAARIGVDERVIFAGEMPPSQMRAALALADAIVLPQREAAAIASDPWGALPLVCGLGRPLIVSNASWQWRTIADSEGAGAIIVADDAAMADALARFAALRQGEAPGAGSPLAPGQTLM